MSQLWRSPGMLTVTDGLQVSSSVYLRSFSSLCGFECSALSLEEEAWRAFRASPVLTSRLTFLHFPCISVWFLTVPDKCTNWLLLFSSLCPPRPSQSPTPFLPHSFNLFSHTVKRPSPCSPGPMLLIWFGPIVYSLHHDTKDIKLTDQWAGARAWLINEALGRRVEGGWEKKGRGRTGQVGWQMHNQWKNRWGLLLSSDKRLHPSSGHTTRSLLTAAFVSHAHELNAALGDTAKKKYSWNSEIASDSFVFVRFCSSIYSLAW